MGEDSLDHIVYQKSVVEFVAVANEYCLFVEQKEHEKRSEYLTNIQKFWSLLYLKATLLPEVDGGDVYAEKFLEEHDYWFLQNKISNFLGPHDRYTGYSDTDHYLLDEEAQNTLSENIMDVYQDLKDFVMSYQLGVEEAMEAALFECREHFQIHWGKQLLNGLRVMHILLYGEQDIDQEQD
ncbi:DUF5063 domain-containing protein [Halosquirtibacter laminarini]|uniref:DUF5063 domain-containing protein n=1 Tax=Halosquirtibacter laminarini TaxID=3374600 RepID=A0AC61NG68_9BACT|nr:DUF5063 domain-containing protein [Prolixibacteraceae bacterium]